MKALSILLLIYLFSFSVIQSATTIDFSNSGTGYTVSGNVITITGEGPFDLTNSYTDKNIVVSASCTLNLNSFSLTNSGTLTPILISSGYSVTMALSGTSSLTDSSTNANDGTIYLQSGASLTLSGTGTLNITPNKMMAINGTDSTSLTVSGGPTINIQSTSTSAGGVYLRSEINFNNAIFTYSCSSGENHAIDTEGTVKIIKGTYTLTSGEGKGIQSETYLYIGEDGGSDSDLTLTITTNNEGIEAKKIYIYSGTIKIDAEEDGINAASSGTDCDEETVQCSGNCECFIVYKGGSLTLTSGEDGIDSNGDITISGGQIVVFAATNTENQPVDQDGLLSISGGTVLAAGSSSMGGVSATTTQTAKTYTGTINSGAKLVATETGGNEILSLTTPKAANYLYFNHDTSFAITLDGTAITLTDVASGSNQGGPGEGGPGAPGNTDTTSTTSTTSATTPTTQNGTDDDDDPQVYTTKGNFLESLNIMLILVFIIF